MFPVLLNFRLRLLFVVVIGVVVGFPSYEVGRLLQIGEECDVMITSYYDPRHECFLANKFDEADEDHYTSLNLFEQVSDLRTA